MIRHLLCLLGAGLLFAATSASAEEPHAHHGPEGFVNPHVEVPHGGQGSFLRARFASGPWPGHDPDVFTVPTATPEPVPAGGATDNARVTWIGHSTVLIQHRGVNVITDPMLSPYASPIRFAGPRRISEPGIALENLPPIDVVVISHDHYDHLDVPTIEALGEGPRYLVPLGLRSWFAGRGVDPARVDELDWWDQRELQVRGERLRVTATPSQHFSGRGLTDRDETLWAAWALEWIDFSAWFGGDTGYNGVQFKEIGRRFGGFDLGIIPIGAYRPRWFMGVVHVNPAEAVRIHQDLGARRSIGVHWGTFVLSQEASHEPPQELRAAVREAGLAEGAFSAWKVGETRAFQAPPPRDQASAASSSGATITP